MTRTLVQFKGTPTEYRMLHYWIEGQLGKPRTCADCHDTAKKVYHWSNISGQYLKELSDWVRLCSSCHRKRDAKPKAFCKHGHKMEGDNLYIMPANSRRLCLTCKMRHRKEYYWRQRNLTDTVGTEEEV